MALRKFMPARDPQRAESEPQHVREYDAATGGYTRNPADRPVPGAGNGTNGRLKGGK
ncbi:hypothetical protein [Streptomyces parvus]|uniref:Uncharacterized protein n=1 Tax=Streptomyces parvus TaxID=66428 RepID=A0A7K3SA83_9ACTN|nr:hypothetical protein [Streptomyces parvus]NEC24427.1 hypothetical protein [Streptomyces parvus]